MVWNVKKWVVDVPRLGEKDMRVKIEAVVAHDPEGLMEGAGGDM
jgi:hypothetical protein